MPTDIFAPLGVLHRPGQSLQKIVRKIVPLASPAGMFSVRAQDDEPRPTHPLECLFNSSAEVYEFLAWFDRRAGSLVPFWVPSYQQDMVPLDTIDAADTTFDIQSIGYAEHLFPLQRRRSIAFVRVDGTFLKRDIVDATDNGNGEETIEINEALGEDFVQSSGNGICFMWYGRLVDDAVSIEWDTSETAAATIGMIELTDAPIGGSGDSDHPIPDCNWIDVTGFVDGKNSGDGMGAPWVTDVEVGLPAEWQYVNDNDPSAVGSGIPLTPLNFKLRFLAVGSVVPLGLEATATQHVTGLVPGETYIQREVYDKSGDWGVGTGLIEDTVLVADGSGELDVVLDFVNTNDGIIMGYTKWWKKVYLVPPGTEDCEETL